eukprot:104031-Pelagomonas_calceolata.AAC.2
MSHSYSCWIRGSPVWPGSHWANTSLMWIFQCQEVGGLILGGFEGPDASVSCAHCAGGVPQDLGALEEWPLPLQTAQLFKYVTEISATLINLPGYETFNAALWHSWSKLTTSVARFSTAVLAGLPQ